MKRLICGLLCASVVTASPGILPYAAAAEIVNAPPAGAVRPIQIGTSQLNVLKGAGPLPVAPGALGIDPTQRTLPAVPELPSPISPSVAPQAIPLAQPLKAPATPAKEDAAQIAKAVAPGLQAINKPGASGEGSARAGDDVTTILQGGTAESSSDGAVEAADSAASDNGLSVSSSHETTRSAPPVPAAAKKALRPKLLKFAVSALRAAAAAGVVVGVQALAVMLAPLIFGAVPVAAVWAVSSGALLLPAALYTRYRLARHDSPALSKVKLVVDLAIGAFVGAIVIAAPAFSLALVSQMASSGVPFGLATGGLTVLSLVGGGKALDVLATGGVLAALPLIMGLGGAGAIALGPLIGMMALPVMATVSFFLGRIVRSAETGQPFSIPGSPQKMRFPAFNWVMMGVVFALTSGYGAVLTNVAFAAWTLFGDKGNEEKTNAEGAHSFGRSALITLSVGMFGSAWAEKIYRLAQKIAATETFKIIKKIAGAVLNFNRLYGALLVYTAITGFASPLTFLVLAFAPERAAHWTERLLRKLHPGAKPAPSTEKGAEETAPLVGRLESAMPRVYHWAKTAAILTLMLGVGFGLGATVFGFGALFKNLAVSAVLMIPQLVFSRWLVKRLMKAEPATPENMPKYYSAYSDAVGEVLGLVNARRAEQGKKPIKPSEKVRVPTGLPNAFAAGPGPNHATIGVTDGIMDLLLDPQNAREGLLRLVQSASNDVQGKQFRVFRKAISGSVPGLSADAAANELSQALVRASDAQIQALGRRMLRGVLGHEFSHVTDRHMLIGSISGAMSSAVAFASYGVMWGVGHVKAAARRITGRADTPVAASPEASSRVLSIEAAKADSDNAKLVDPITAGAAIRTFPALLRVFAALWGPTILQIIQMAGSRNNEAQADQDGAYLTDDPEALALALGMLTTWRPKPGFSFEYSHMPRLAALSQFMTVDPIAQLRQAGVLPKDDGRPQWAADKNDDWMFNLWVTHPDTAKRIETLHDIAETLHKNGAQDFRPQPPPSLAPASEPARANWLRRAWEKFKAFVRVLPDKARNKEFWKFTWGQALLSLGLDFHYTALPRLVDPKDDQPQRVLYNRAATSGAQLVSSMATGAAVDRFSVQKIMVWTYLGRSLMLLAVPLLFHFGALSFIAFQMILFAAGFLQSTSTTAASVAFNRILAEDTAYYNKANAVFNLIMSLVGIIGPLMAGSFIVMMDARFGFLSGNALSYGLYGLMIMGTMLLYRKLRIPRDEMLQARRDLWAKLKPKRGLWPSILAIFLAAGAGPVIKGVSAARVDNKPVLLVEVKGDATLVRDVPAEFAGYPVKVVPVRSVWHELIDGFRLIFNNKFLKIYLLFSTVVALMADPIVFSAIPRFIDGVLHVAKDQQGGVFGLYLAATGLGTGLASFIMMMFRDRAEPEFEAALAASKKGLASSAGLDDEKAESALDGVRSAKSAILERYRENWRKDPAWRPVSAIFSQEFLAQAAAALNAQAFGGAKSPAELKRLLDESGLGARLWSWSARSFEPLMKDARQHAATGLTKMERQGRWSSWLNGAGWLLYWGVFFLPTLHLSLAAIVVASMLQAPAMAIWSALVQHVLGRRYPESMGKIYSAINFYTLAFGILGPIIFSPLVRALPITWTLVVTAAALTIVAVLDFLQPSKSFPLEKGPKT